LDGSKLVFQSDQDSFMDIHVVNFDGSNRVNLTNHPAYEISPQFQP
jgi:Tol biopolymer transport system component